MKVYLVGGAVRDGLMGLPIKEKDWVVVGAVPKDLLALGYQPVGKDFPVFLHPLSKEEYALARTEKKTGPGYKGFEVYADASVTLVDDLKRRDLTINAIAEDDNGQLVDPYSGVEDIRNRILRHVSPAFSEDPLRVLRLARFKAKFADFTIHEDTCSLCVSMVESGELSSLVKERVWLEWQKAFQTQAPEVFVTCLYQLGAWSVLHPELTDPLQDAAVLRCVKSSVKGDELICYLGLYCGDQAHRAWLASMPLAKRLQSLARLLWSLYHDQGQAKGPEQRLRDFYQWDVFRRLERYLRACDLLRPLLDSQGRALLDQQIQSVKSLCALPIAEVAKQASGDVAEAVFKHRLLYLRAFQG